MHSYVTRPVLFSCTARVLARLGGVGVTIDGDTAGYLTRMALEARLAEGE
ncbi:MAG: hypothetical protein RBT51_03520 [Ectothiorhodospiraceae bacterium]|jgi:hypothetical protein|nr:hypothetical protein [Ectothiorhodospiraceae bacterium]